MRLVLFFGLALFLWLLFWRLEGYRQGDGGNPAPFAFVLFLEIDVEVMAAGFFGRYAGVAHLRSEPLVLCKIDWKFKLAKHFA